MASVTHTKVSVKSDGVDSTLVRPSDWNAAHVVSDLATTPTGRLTLTTATPVMTSTVSGATTIYYTPYVGNTIPLYDGTNMVPTTFTELSVLTTDATKSPAAIGAFKVNDWFVWDDSGTRRIGHGPDWTSDSARSAGTALVRINGIWLNNASITNGPAAQRGTYVGTTRSDGTSTLDWIFGGVSAGGAAGFFGVWNAYNRVDVETFTGDSTDSWNVASATFAQNAAGTTISFVSGLAEDYFDAAYHALATASATGFCSAGVGYDVTNAASGSLGWLPANSSGGIMGRYSNADLGYHFAAALDASGAGTAVFFGDAGAPGKVQSGLWFRFKM